MNSTSASEVCPLVFHPGQPGAPERLCADPQFVPTVPRRLATTLQHADADAACAAAFVAGPVALAWSRFDAATRARVRER